ncbi:MAG TPA: hypothetical protein VE287_01570, partial [Actinopolymorphaceae bacterium]|nr:hypothetical protein [Actinopolymorphaceae bacterium]
AAGNGAAVERRLMIGAPGEDAGAGAVVVIAGITAAEIWKQVTGRPEAGDGFGSAGAGLFFAP